MTTGAAATADTFRFATVDIWLRDAAPTVLELREPANELRRAAAARSLLEFDRRAVAAGEERDPRVVEFLARKMEEVRLELDPVAALAVLLGRRRGPGRPHRDDGHIEDLAIAVFALTAEGSSIEDAVDIVIKRPGLAMGRDYALKCYFDFKSDEKNARMLKAAYAMRRLDRGLPAD